MNDRYRIIVAYTPAELAMIVNNRMDEGWTPIGGIVQLLHKNGAQDLRAVGIGQAMIRSTDIGEGRG